MQVGLTNFSIVTTFSVRVRINPTVIVGVTNVGVVVREHTHSISTIPHFLIVVLQIF